MTSRIDRTARAASAHRTPKGEARKSEPAAAAAPANLPVPVGPVVSHPRVEPPNGEAVFEAQLIGQDGQRRGLRAGPPLLETARSAYNRTEWSGSRDRRARKGRTAREDI